MASSSTERPHVLDRIGAAGGVIFLAAAAAMFFSFARTGLEGPETADVAAAAISARSLEVGVASAFAAVAGVAVLLLVGSLHRAAPLPLGARLAGAAWGTAWIVAGGLLYASVELAGYYEFPPGAKTASILGYLVSTGPATTVPAGLLILAVGLGPEGGHPRWFRRASLVAGSLVLLGALSLAVSFMGMLGLAFLPLWLVASSVALVGAREA